MLASLESKERMKLWMVCGAWEEINVWGFSHHQFPFFVSSAVRILHNLADVLKRPLSLHTSVPACISLCISIEINMSPPVTNAVATASLALEKSLTEQKRYLQAVEPWIPANRNVVYTTLTCTNDVCTSLTIKELEREHIRLRKEADKRTAKIRHEIWRYPWSRKFIWEPELLHWVEEKHNGLQTNFFAPATFFKGKRIHHLCRTVVLTLVNTATATSLPFEEDLIKQRREIPANQKS